MMDGLDYLGAEAVGLDFLDIAKGAAGALSGTGGILSAGAKKGGKDDVQAAVEKQRLEDERKAAEKSASQTRLMLGVAGAAVAALGTALYLRKK